jgi:hypothetical protein
MKQNLNSSGLQLKERGPVWKVNVKVEDLKILDKSKSWKIKVILN